MRKESHMPETNTKNSTTCQLRAAKCFRLLQEYFQDAPEANLVEFLTDAMHWCDQIGNDFGQLLEDAYEQFQVDRG